MDNSTSNPINSFCKGAETILRLNRELSGKEESADILRKMSLWKAGIFRIVVMGEINKGKSSFINALLGHRDLVPVCSNVATSTIYKICYGPQIGYRVFFSKASGKGSKEIAASELADYGTEDGNPGNEKQVDFIEVFSPSPLLKAGLVIIDTPGLGGLFRQHKRITYEYVPQSDAVFLVTDSVQSPIGQSELDLLADLKKVTRHIYFVQTKSCVVDTEVCEARRRNNLSILTDPARGGFNGDAIKYFVVDSEMRLKSEEDGNAAPEAAKEELEWSGFEEVERFVDGEIRPNVQRLILQRASMELQPVVSTVARALAQRGQILNARTNDERKAQKEAIDAAKRELDDWEANCKPRLKRELEDGLEAIRRLAEADMTRFRPQGELHRELMGRLSCCSSAQEVESAMKELQGDLGNSIAEAAYGIQDKIKDGCLSLLSRVGRDSSLGIEIPERENFALTPVSAQNASGTIYQPAGFDKVRNGYYGYMSGGAIGATIGGAIGSVVPVIGTAFGAWVGGAIGSLWGGSASVNSARENALHSAIQQANNLISSWLSNAYAEMHSQIGDFFADFRRDLWRAVEDSILAMQTSFKRRVDEINRLANARATEIEEGKKKAAEMAAMLDRALADMGFKTR